MARKKQYNAIPVALSEKEFNEFILPHLKRGSRGPNKKISFYKLLNYILKLMHTGCQWKNIPIEKDALGNPEIHYTSIFKMFRFWVKEGCFDERSMGQDPWSVHFIFFSNLYKVYYTLLIL